MQTDDSTVEMRYVFQDGEENYPGTLPLRLRYWVSGLNELVVEYEATAIDKATVANFTSHIFWNLAGHNNGDILSHVLQMNADQFLPIDETLTPTGEIRSVTGTVMDFAYRTTLGQRIDADDKQLRLGRGYDHYYVLKKSGEEFSLAARVAEPKSGRLMEVWSSEPGLQVYSGNFLEGKCPRDVGKGGALYGFRSGFCLEPSKFPDAPNKPNFPPAVLGPGERYRAKTVYSFSAPSSKS